MGQQKRQRSEPPKPLRLFLFSNPRCNSNLFVKLFQGHPDLAVNQYYLHVAHMYGPERLMLTTNPAINDLIRVHKDDTFQVCFERMLEFIMDAEAKGKIPWVKDHIHQILNPLIMSAIIPCPRRDLLPTPIIIDKKNPPSSTIARAPLLAHPFLLPDSFIATLAPVILIRHPARLVASFCRVGKKGIGVGIDDEDFPTLVSLRWSRLAYDFWAVYYRASDGKWPIVVDGDDLVRDTEGVVSRICKRVGIDAAKMTYSWDMMSKEEYEAQSPIYQAMLENIWKSSGVVRNEACFIDPVLDEEQKRWAKLYSDKMALKMRVYVDEAMEDYEYLRACKL